VQAIRDGPIHKFASHETNNKIYSNTVSVKH